ncbi:MAG: TPM domain-containing protein, partial [Aeromonas sp.]
DFVVRVRNNEIEQGFLACVEQTRAILTDAFPATRDQNELPDSLIILDKP